MLIRMATNMVPLLLNGTNHIRMFFSNPSKTKECSFLVPFLQFFENTVYALVYAHFMFVPVEISRDEVTVIPVFDVEGQYIHY